MEIYGYKAFDKGIKNRYGKNFEVGKTYIINAELPAWGNSSKHGYHFCKNLEDTLRYFDAMNGEIDICYVKGFGKFKEYEDDYYGYYEMYSCSNLEIIKLLSRDEIITHMLKKGYVAQERFISGFKLTNEEIEMFLLSNPELSDHIEFYQKNNIHVFKRKKIRLP